MSNFSWSVSDLIREKGFQKAFGEDNKQAIYALLHSLGMDINRGVEERCCTHRNRKNEVVTCVRYEGWERTERAWITSGYASVDAYIDSTNDYSLKQELLNMGRTGESFSEHELIDNSISEVERGEE